MSLLEKFSISLILQNTVYEISNTARQHKETVQNVIIHLKPNGLIGAFITEWQLAGHRGAADGGGGLSSVERG